jgi:hypothetical protein
VVSAPCSAARRLEPEAARQPREIQILDALLFIGEEFLQKSIHLNKPILFLFDLFHGSLPNIPVTRS